MAPESSEAMWPIRGAEGVFEGVTKGVTMGVTDVTAGYKNVTDVTDCNFLGYTLKPLRRNVFQSFVTCNFYFLIYL